MAVAKDCGRVHNPLFIYGPTGSGKTHLLHAIGGVPGPNVLRLSTAVLVMRMTDSIRAENFHRFTEELADVRALLLDDIHVLHDRPRTLETLAIVLRDLVRRDVQIVATSVTRDLFFDVAKVATVDYPDGVAAAEILRRAALHYGVALPKKSLRRMSEPELRS